MMKTKIAVLVSGGGTNLQALIDAQFSGALENGVISVVVADRADTYAVIRAREEDIPTAVVDKKTFASKSEFEAKLKSVIDEHGAELIVLAGFLSILSEDFVKEFPKRIINVHPSLIPSFCGDGFYGLKVHEAALERGVKVTGATVHFVNEITDGGEIIMQKAVLVKRGDTPEILQQRVMTEAEHILLPAAVDFVAQEIREEKERAQREKEKEFQKIINKTMKELNSEE